VMIEEVVKANNLETVEQVTHYTKAGGGCASCHEGIEEIIAKVKAERAASGDLPVIKSTPAAAPSACSTPAPAPAAPARLTSVQRIKKIEEVLEAARPMLQRDHGDIELVEVQGKKVFVTLKGACSGCMMEAATLGGIQQQICEALGELVQVLPASLMALES
jgi:NifU-like protein